MSGRTGWSPDDLQLIQAAGELLIAVQRNDGTARRPLPIWVVCAGDRVFVRTWHRRDTGWYGQALVSHRARISVPGLTAAVTVTDIGPDSRTEIDAAYRSKYGSPGAASMVTDEAAATTLRLDWTAGDERQEAGDD